MASSQEDVTVVLRPLKIIAFVCGCLSLILCIMCVASEYWLEADGFRQGLWKYCHTPDPAADPWQCDSVEKVIESGMAWIKACAALTIISLLAVLAGTTMAGVGLLLNDIKMRYTLFMASVIAHAFAVLCIVVALIVFPAMFMQEIKQYRAEFNFEKWYFAWSYGVAWGAGIFAFGAALLMFSDRRNDDIIQKTYYTE